MNSPETISFLRHLKKISLDFPLVIGACKKEFAKRLLECLGTLEHLMKIHAVSLQCTSCHEELAILSRFFTKTDGNGDVPPYYPHAEEIHRSEWTAYHFWELIDDVREHHLREAGAFTGDGLSFHLYPQDFSTAVFEKIEPSNPIQNLYIEDECISLPLKRQGSKYWFTPSDECERSLLPFNVEIWYTDHKIQLELFINWDVYAIKDTASNKALQKQLISLIHAGWELDQKASDIWLSECDIERIKKESTRGSLNYQRYTMHGFFEPELIIEMI